MGSSSSTTTPSFSLKILLISIFVLTAATAFHFFIPSILNFIISDIPIIWSVILSWLKPPYLYVVINGIIITIAVTSRFHHHYSQNQSPPLIHETNTLPPPDLISPVPAVARFDELENSPVVFVSEFTETEVPPVEYQFPVEGIETVPFNGSEAVITEVSPVEYEFPVVGIETVPFDDSEGVVTEDSVDKFVVTKSTWNSPPEFVYPVTEKPLVKSRFANQRKTTKSVTEGVKSLKVAKPKKHETLETTWKMITDGRHIPLNRHLRKSDTFENNHHYRNQRAPSSDVDSGEQVSVEYNAMKKFKTFHDNHKNHRVVAKLRREGSPSQDELNRRVEAFIKKFNDEMRLQRQESIKRYMEMINPGAE